jgi:hypothetical protein
VSRRGEGPFGLLADVELALQLAIKALAQSAPSRPIQLLTVVDPQNSTGKANDKGPGTAEEPLLTVFELNSRLNFELDDPVTIQFLGDVTENDAALDLTKMSFGVDSEGGAIGGLTIIGALIVEKVTSHFTSVTTMDSSSNIRQSVGDTTTDFSTFNQFFILDTSIANDGAMAVIANGSLHAADTSSPITNAIPGEFTDGDSYTIVRGSILPLGDLRFGGPRFGTGIGDIPLSFQNFDFTVPNEIEVTRPTFPSAVTVCEGCRFTAAPSCASGGIIQAFGCAFMDPTRAWGSSAFATLAVQQGYVSLTGQEGWAGELAFDGDAYVTGLSLIASIQNGLVSLQIGAVQFQDMGYACILASDTSVVIEGLLWGTGNAETTLHLIDDTTIQILETIPIAVSAAGDFILANGNARAFDETTGLYTAPIAQTWTAFQAATPGGFGGNAHNPTSNTHLVTITP